MIFNARCDCGNLIQKKYSEIKYGSYKSCGCQRWNGNRKTHGMTGEPEHKAWVKMRERCNNPREIGYARYGGRGIKVCSRWAESFDNFFDDMGLKPSPKHSIDRIDNDKDYSPDNCRWATRTEQCRNRRSNVVLEYNGERKILREWSEQTGVSETLLRGRLRRGWSIKDSFEKEKRMWQVTTKK